MKKTEKMMIDSTGCAVNLKYVPRYDRAKDKIVRKIVARFMKERAALEKLLADCVADIDGLSDLIADGRHYGGAKGNIRLTSFDGALAVSIKQQYRIQLDERVAGAREEMLGYARSLAGKLEGADGQALTQIISTAFEADRSSMLSVGRVLALLRLDIKAAQWVRARSILQEAMTPVRGKAYLYVWKRLNTQMEFVPIKLDLADCWTIKDSQSDEK